MVAVLSLGGCLSSQLQSPPSLCYGMSRLHYLENIAFFQPPPTQFKYVDFNVEFINVMPFHGYY